MTAVCTPFPRRPIPVQGESIYGYERRFASCTRYESLGAFRTATGLKEVVPGSTETRFSQLALLAGLGPTDLHFMRWTGRDGARRGTTAMMLGHLVHSGYLRTQYLRFCPTCLAENGAPEQRIHYQVWQVLQFCACPRHGTLLEERCDRCGRLVEQARKTKAWACACGRELTEIPTTTASAGALSMSATILRHLGHDPFGQAHSPCHDTHLPPPFANLDFDALLTVASKIGTLAMISPEMDPPASSVERPYTGAAMTADLAVPEIAKIMSAAHPIIVDWPTSSSKLFSSLADRNRAPSQRHPVQAMFATVGGHRLLGRIRSANGAVIRTIDDALEDWLFHNRGIYIDGRRRPKLSVDGDTAIDIADALRRLEGRGGNLLCISAWVDAGAIKMVGGKVSLTSVNQTVDAISHLRSSEFEDGLSGTEWSTRFIYNEHYRRSDALRDVLTGHIRVRRCAGDGDQGLGSIEVCHRDLIQRARNASASARLLMRSPKQRAARARARDAFYRSGKVYALLEELWPGRRLPYLEGNPRIRSVTKVWKYPDRDLRQRFYSVADALEVVESQQIRD